MSTLKVVTLQNPASSVANITLDAAGTTTLGGVVTFNSSQTFPNLVSSITAGTGLTGGTITTTGTIALDTAYTDTLYLKLAGGTLTGAVTFAVGQSFPGVVTSVTAGTGLTGGTITSTGTVALDTTYTDTLYLGLAGGTLTGDVTFAGTQTFPAQTLQEVTDAGASTTNAIDVAGLTAAGLTYPAADGTADQVVTTDGAGGLGWLTTAKVVSVPGSSASAGAANQIAFGGGNFYFHDGTQWWQVAGVSF